VREPTGSHGGEQILTVNTTNDRTRQGNPKAAPYTPTAIVKALTGTGVLPSGPAYAVDTLSDILRTMLVFKDLATVFYATALSSSGITSALSASQTLRMQAALTTEIAHATVLRSHLSAFPTTSISDPYQTFYFPANIFTSISATYDWYSEPPYYYQSGLQTIANGQFIDFLQLLEGGLASAEDAALNQLTALAWNSGSSPAKIPYTPEVTTYPGAAELMASMEGVDFGHLTLANELNAAYWCDRVFANDEDDFIFIFESLVHGSYPVMAMLLPFVQRNYSALYYSSPTGTPTTFSNAGWTPYSLQLALQQQARTLVLPTVNDTQSYL
jgi:hypothetical protein